MPLWLNKWKNSPNGYVLPGSSIRPGKVSFYMEHCIQLHDVQVRHQLAVVKWYEVSDSVQLYPAPIVVVRKKKLFRQAQMCSFPFSLSNANLPLLAINQTWLYYQCTANSHHLTVLVIACNRFILKCVLLKPSYILLMGYICFTSWWRSALCCHNVS